ncbi:MULTISPECIES: hypothetical protein [Streptomyces]|uniref:Polymerase nucleotidyl transferase domain-containing protein n=2 Tax=Streptomyces TaxID=1883 RepID=A0ABU4K3M1_9ACTN|nr:hypothetical protein [Streptomyces roseolus]MDX2292336.1 hypothetical protein [Streptomyces roseolus]
MVPDLSTCLPELEARGLLPADVLSVSIVGSVARGWGNAGSDYDFNIVTTSPWTGADTQSIPVPLRPDFLPTASLNVGDRRWEIKYWTDDQIGQVIDKVGWPQFESGEVGAKTLIEAEELFLERLMSAVPLHGAEWIAERQAQVAGSAFQAFITTRSLSDADGSVEDAVGQLAAGDLYSAVISARNALGHTVDALLESRGCYGSKTPKWRARRMRETPFDELPFETYWALETMRDLDPETPEKWVRTVVSLCKDLTLEVEI